MQSNSIFLIFAAVVTGAVVPFRAGANAALGRSLGHPLWGTLVSLCVSLACILPVMLLTKVQLPTLSNLVHAPRWIWIGGIVGVVYITGALMLAPKLGAAGFIMAVIAGQMLASIIIDQWGLVGLPGATRLMVAPHRSRPHLSWADRDAVADILAEAACWFMTAERLNAVPERINHETPSHRF